MGLLSRLLAPVGILGRMFAVLYLRVAVSRLRKHGSRAELAQALRNLGELERWLPGDATRRHYEEAVAIYRELDEPLKLAHTVRHLGDVYHDRRRPELAEPCYHEALALYRRYGRSQPGHFANAVRVLAVLKEEAGEFDEATRLWQEAHDLYASINEPMDIAIAESAAWLALLAHRRGDVQPSREWLSKASAAADASRDSDSLKWVRKVRATIEGS